MKRKMKKKPDYKSGRSQAALDSWDRPGGIHKDQIKDSRRDRKSTRQELKKSYYD